jgi:hypothetical protein
MLSQLEFFPDDCLPSRMGVLTVYAGPRLVVDNTPPQQPSTHHSIQLVLDLKSTVPRLVPKTRSVFLGMDSTVFFRNSPPLRRLVEGQELGGLISTLQRPAHRLGQELWSVLDQRVSGQLTQKQERHVSQVHLLARLNRERRDILGQALRGQLGVRLPISSPSS